MDGGVRLHCCGGHHYRDHGDAQTPAGTHFFLPSLSARGERGGEDEGDGIGVYGTGENDGAVVLFLPSPHYPVGDRAKLLADRIARGANVTVILPMVGALETTLPDVTPEEGKKEKRKRSAPVTVEAYIEGVARLGVSSIGLLATTPDALPADTTGLACVVLLSTTTTAAVSSSSSSCSQESMEKIGVPVSVITLSAVASEETKGQQEGGGNIRRTEITTDHGVGLLNDESAQGYTKTMREVLYFFKKHLHDWS